jgi:nicotinamidase-related amidase
MAFTRATKLVAAFCGLPAALAVRRVYSQGGSYMTTDSNETDLNETTDASGHEEERPPKLTRGGKVTEQSIAKTRTALVIIDIQACFLDAINPDGSGAAGNLPVAGAHKIIDVNNKLRDYGDGCLWDTVVLTKDFHPAGHISFGSTHPVSWHQWGVGLTPEDKKAADRNLGPFDKVKLWCIKPTKQMKVETDASCCPEWVITTPGAAQQRRWKKTKACTVCADMNPTGLCSENVQMLWPDHCVQKSKVEDHGFPPALKIKKSDEIVYKGTNKDVDSYSGFLNNTKSIPTTLPGFLKERGIDHVVLTGIAEDVCVQFSAEDAHDMGFKVTLVADAAKGVNMPGTPGEAGAQAMVRAMKGAKGEPTGFVVNSDELLRAGGCSR